MRYHVVECSPVPAWVSSKAHRITMTARELGRLESARDLLEKLREAWRDVEGWSEYERAPDVDVLLGTLEGGLTDLLEMHGEQHGFRVVPKGGD